MICSRTGAGQHTYMPVCEAGIPATVTSWLGRCTRDLLGQSHTQAHTQAPNVNVNSPFGAVLSLAQVALAAGVAAAAVLAGAAATLAAVVEVLGAEEEAVEVVEASGVVGEAEQRVIPCLNCNCYNRQASQ